MLVDIKKRTLLTKILPKTGSISDQLIRKELEDKIINIPDEIKQKVNFKDMGNGSFTYDIHTDLGVEFNWSESEKHVLKRGVNALDKAEEISPEILDVCIEIRDL